MSMPGNIGMLLLAIYLILIGAIALFRLDLQGFSIIVPILALAAGILIILKK